MEKLTFALLLKEARTLKFIGLSRVQRQLTLHYWILGAKYYYVEQG